MNAQKTKTISLNETYSSRLSLPEVGYRPISEMRFASINNGWVIACGRILTTKHGGKNWASRFTRRFLTEHLIPEAVAPIDSYDSWLLASSVSNSIRLLLTRDGGYSWDARHSFPHARESVFFFLDTVRGWVTSGTGGS